MMTLFFLFRWEEKNKLKEAEKCYSRCLELNESHSVAKEALNSVLRFVCLFVLSACAEMC